MPLEITARAIVKTDDDGRYYMDIPNYHWFAGELSRFEPETAIVVTVKKYYKKRSLKQNNLFWAYITILADYFGYSTDTMKALVGLKWLKKPIQDREGNEMVDPMTNEAMFEITSTTALNTFEMAQLCDNIREWALDGWNVVLPLPQENTQLNFHKS